MQDSWFSSSQLSKNILFADGCRLPPPQLFKEEAFAIQGNGLQPLLIWRNIAFLFFKNSALAFGLGFQDYWGESIAGVDQDFMAVDKLFHALCRSEGHFCFVGLPRHDFEASIFLALRILCIRFFFFCAGCILTLSDESFHLTDAGLYRRPGGGVKKSSRRP
jgi:hypothetical protein